MPNCDKCIWSTRSGNCVLWECKFVSHEDARRMIEEKERKDEKAVRTMTLEQAIERAEDTAISAIGCECREEHRQLAAWLRELQERRKAPEIVTCYECEHYIPVSNSWGKCSVHSSPTEKQRTCQSCDYCSWAERRTE